MRTNLARLFSASTIDNGTLFAISVDSGFGLSIRSFSSFAFLNSPCSLLDLVRLIIRLEDTLAPLKNCNNKTYCYNTKRKVFQKEE